MDLLKHLDFWLMIATLGAAVYYFVWKDRIQPLITWLARFLRGGAPVDEPRRPSPARLKPRPKLRNAVTKPGTKFAPRNEPFTASEKEVTSPLPVTSLRNEVTETDQVSTLEAALIAVKLSQQVAPSTIAKQLPGYTPGRYKEFSAKVQTVKAALEAAEAQSLAYQPLSEERVV
jgi:hypothetical protein